MLNRTSPVDFRMIVNEKVGSLLQTKPRSLVKLSIVALLSIVGSWIRLSGRMYWEVFEGPMTAGMILTDNLSFD